jgi:hypothetical protein
MSPVTYANLVIAERKAHGRLAYLLRVYGSSGVSLATLEAAWAAWRALAGEVEAAKP